MKGGCRTRAARGARLAALTLGLAAPAPLYAAPPAAAPQASREVVFTGMCDASAAVALAGDRFAVADDEDSVLRVYDADGGGAPLRSVDLSASLFPEKAGKGKRKKSPQKVERSKVPESDIEAAARVGDLAFWMTSHGRNRAGKRKAARLHFFATRATGSDALRLVGQSYDALLDDLVADPRYAGFDLAAAARKAPKEPGGLNIEALGERPEGGVWIGFRSPNPGGRALLAPLRNPEGLIAGETAQLGDPVLLELGGLGVRSILRWRGRTLLVAGGAAGNEVSRLYTWDGRGAPVPIPGIDLAGLNPEAFFAPEERDEILLLSDDGAVAIDGRKCKGQSDPARKRFRGRWIALPVR